MNYKIKNADSYMELTKIVEIEEILKRVMLLSPSFTYSLKKINKLANDVKFKLKIDDEGNLMNKDEKIDINTIDQDAIKAEIKGFVQPVINAQPEPEINLQWVFNLVYQDRFK